MRQPVYVAGVGLWGVGYRHAAAWLAGERNEAEVEPACALLPSRLARRTSLLTRMAIEVATQAAPSTALATTPTVFATAYGETETLGALLEQLCLDGELSPTRFHNSVYNTASGYFTIAAGNKTFTTTIAAGPDTVPMALLEGICLLEERGGDVVIIVADEAPTSPLQLASSAALAAAIHLTTQRPESGGFGQLRNLRQDSGAKRTSISPEFKANPVASVLPLIRTLSLHEHGTMPLSNEGGSGWVIDVHPTEALS
jgi:hypothetical protein